MPFQNTGFWRLCFIASFFLYALFITTQLWKIFNVSLQDGVHKQHWLEMWTVMRKTSYMLQHAPEETPCWNRQSPILEESGEGINFIKQQKTYLIVIT